MLDVKQELQSYDDHLLLRNFSLATRRSYGSALRKFLEWRGNEGLVEALTEEDARQYLLYRCKLGKSWQTINGD